MRGLDRREALLAGLGAWGAAMTAQAAVDPLAGAALYADVKAYSDFGEHRTGTPGDTATTRWMVQALKAAGYVVETQRFDYPVFQLGRTELVLAGRNLETFPYWTPAPTPAVGITAPLSATGGPGKIALVTLPAGSGGGLYSGPPPAITAAVDSGALAVIAVTETALGELSALNRTPKAPAWKVPVLLAAGRDGAALKDAAAAGRPVTVRLEGRSVPGHGENVIGRKPGAGKALVISTPKSGWFHCAGERGSGVAIWLGLARWLATTPHEVVLVAASGHEFDGYGGQRFSATLAPKPAGTKLWAHIGANVAMYDFAVQDGRVVRQDHTPSARLLAVSEPLLPSAQRAFAGQVGYSQVVDIDRQKAPGEVAHFQELGYSPIVGMVAASPLHHTRRDLPDVTAPAVLEPVARGLKALIADAMVS